MLRSALLAPLLVVLFILPACGSAPSNPNTLLSDAKFSIDHSGSLHFHIESDESVIKAPGAYLISGDGDAKRPDIFSGDVDASVDGLRVPVKILSINGNFYVQIPFSNTWDIAHPNDYGFSDPSTLIDPSGGLSSLLTGGSNVTLLDRYRLNGEELEDVSTTVSAAKITAFISTANPSRSVTVKFGVDVSSHQLRQVVLTGLYLAGASSPVTYTITLTDYGKSVDVTPPA